MDEDGEVITSLTLYEGYTTRGDFDFFLTRSPYHATSGDELGTATVADPSIISLTQSHGFFSAKALKVGSTTITGTLNGEKGHLTGDRNPGAKRIRLPGVQLPVLYAPSPA